jgi:CRISPR/Cas system CSM-associated protein Csm3 (group 7 of RAMP superfamily)
MKYKVTFLDYWHLSSGLSAGAKLDRVVTKDENGLPYIPGKTIKGLIREMAELTGNFDFITQCFGSSSDMGECNFSNVEIEENTKKTIIKDSLQNQLFDEIASTKIDENGIAQTGSLREIEVVVPISLFGEIKNIPPKYKQEMIKALKKVKRMGLNRNRGLGRCAIDVVGEEK